MTTKQNRGTAVILAILAIIVLVGVLVVANVVRKEAIKLGNVPQQNSDMQQPEATSTITLESDQEIKQLQTYSTDNSIESIQTDLKNTDLNNLDKEMGEIEQELDNL